MKAILWFLSVLVLMSIIGFQEARYKELERSATSAADMLDETHVLYQTLLIHQHEQCVQANTYYVQASAYTARPQECNDDPGNTAIMERPVPGWTIAVSRDLASWLGKRVYIEGIGVRRVNDLMNSRYSQRIDILKPTVADAREWGVKEVAVYLIGE